MSINVVAISGNCTRDASLRSTQGGTAVLTFGVAVNERRKNPQTDEWENVPQFVDCTLFGNRATALQQYLTKGTKVAVYGKLRYSSWDDNGQKRSKLEVIAEEVEFLSPREGGQQVPQQQQYVSPQQYQQLAQQSYAAPAPQPAYQAPQQQYQQPQQRYAQPSFSSPQPTQPELYDESIPF